jgi:hypothetical protein
LPPGPHAYQPRAYGTYRAPWHPRLLSSIGGNGLPLPLTLTLTLTLTLPRFWQHILDDAQLGHVFARPDGRRRTAQDLKDKWATLMREETRG